MRPAAIRVAWATGLSALFCTCCLAADAGFDVCGVIPRSTIEAVQGEPVLEVKTTARVAGGLTIAQCYYTLPTLSRSVSLEVTIPGPEPASRTRAKDHWQKLFHGERDDASSAEAAPQGIRGVGQEAYWVGNPLVGALYALHGDGFVRVSVGGAAEQVVRLRKSKTLARAALKRLGKRG